MISVLFDLDGTLVNTKNDVALSVNLTLKKMGYPSVSREHIFARLGYGPGRLIWDCLPDNIDPDTRESARHLFSKIYGENLVIDTALYDGISEVLNMFSKYKLAVVTNKSPFHTHETLKKLKISKKFDFVWTVPFGGNHKPDPAGINDTITALKTDKAGAFMVGDTEADIAAGKNAGITTIGVTWGYRNREQIVDMCPDYIVDNPLQLLDIIK